MMPDVTEPYYFSKQVAEARRFYLDLHPQKRPGATVASGGVERCLPDYNVQRPGFSHLTIEFVSRGLGTLVLGGREYALKPGTVFVYGRGIPHRIQSSSDHELIKYFVAFSGKASRDLMRECQILPGAVMQVMHPDQVRQVFDDLIAHGLGDHANRARMCDVALQYLVMKIADLAVPHEHFSTAAVATYQRCRQFIEEHFLEIHSLKEVAERCHVDPAYLCRLFKRFRRQSPFQYLQNLQMNRAADRLQGGGCSVKETAQELGFADPYNFSRTFKRVFGISPMKLLKRDK